MCTGNNGKVRESDNLFRRDRRHFLKQAGLGILALGLPKTLQATTISRPAYRETIQVLKLVHQGEVLANQRYLAFAKKAMREGHRNIAHLFTALAASEAIHAHNFKNILAGLGIKVEKTDTNEIQISSTRKNLKFASEVELAEIDTRYPNFLKRISQENHKEAFEKIAYAWEAEQQHRELIRKILSGTGIFFGVLTRKFRKATVRYFVCQNCGSTLTGLPDGTCPICGLPVETYREIKLS